jgi:rhomboid protease GluP
LELSPGLKKFLEKIGINTTRLQWKLFEMERKRDAPKEAPAQVRWMKYRHKFCPNCKGLVDRDEKICPHCGAQVPSFVLYRIMRTIGLVLPEGGAIVVFGFVILMLAYFAAMVVIGGPRSIMLPPGELLDRFGAQDYSLVNIRGEYWRMLAFGLIHIGIIHIGFNTLALMQVGPQLEAEIGSKRMLVLVTICQLSAAFAIYKYSLYGVAGASGWLFGLIGFGIAYNHRLGGRHRLIRNFYIQWAIYGLIFGLLIRASNTAHIGGMVGGIVMGLIADKTPARRTPWTIVWEILFWPCLAAWGAAIVLQIRSIVAG